MSDPHFHIHLGDALTVLRSMPDEFASCVVTSPPYWGLRDYGVSGQIGLERTPEDYVSKLVEVFREVKRVLADDGTLWLNLGDSYNAYNGGAGPGSKLSQTQSAQRPQLSTGYGLQDKTLKPKDLIGIPWRVAFALPADGWYLRADIIWHKPNPMPESVTDRPTKAHEYLFLLAKSQKYFYDRHAILEPLRTAESENYPARAKILGRGQQDYNSARVGDRDKSGGFPPSYNGSSFTKGKTAEPHANVGQGPRNEHPGRNKRSVWTLSTCPTPDAHFATYPLELPETCILAGCPVDGVVLDPFAGAGTTGLAALKNGRRFVGIELNPDYIAIAHSRTQSKMPLLAATGSI